MSVSADAPVPALRGCTSAASALWFLYHRTRSVEDRNALVTYYVDLTEKVVRSAWGGRITEDNAFVSIETLVAAGHKGLLRGVEMFDPARGVKPETFLSQKIRSAVLDNMRSLDPLSRKDQAAVKAGTAETPAITTPIPMSGIEDFDAPAPAAAFSPEGLERLKDALVEGFKGCTRRQATILALHHLEGLSIRQVARAEGLSYRSARTALNKPSTFSRAS